MKGYPEQWEVNAVRTFETGATRDSDTSKLDFEGFLSPLVIEEYGRYMHACRLQADGSLRASDNWQKGIPRDVYIKSAWRHFLKWWVLHRAGHSSSAMAEMMALLFNVMGYAHDVLQKETYRVDFEAWRKAQVR